ncbi:hypothetical protein FB451DRAFT_738190 [Mycena latifolia]|nr:hypothetical protein FB451DRAFT_738190 [Mycena latifolia]
MDILSLLHWLQLPPLLVEPRHTATAGRGLFAVARIPPSTPLFTVPARALLNTRSLAPHYPPALTAVQLIALHLCLYRPLHLSHSLDPLFGPYISTLPREFNDHPLTRHVSAAGCRDLPPSVATALARLHARYLHDWNTVRGYVRGNLHLLSQKPGVRLDRGDDALQEDFLWAWLNVGPCMTTRLSDAERSKGPPIPRLGDPLTLLSPNTPTEPGAELHLTYGAHPNRTLFIEYGFVAPCAPDDARAEVDVQDIVEPIFNGDDGNLKKKMLQDAGYWGDWTLDGSPAVSYRLITALRLLHVPLGGPEDDLQRWRDTLTGLRDTVSEANESAWQETVVDVCSTLIQRAQDHRVSNGGLLDAVEMLWEEEYHVALRVSNMHN